MGIQLLGASTGLSASDLITTPQWVELGSYTGGYTATINFSNLSQSYRTLRLLGINVYPSGASNLSLRVNSNSNSIYAKTSRALRSESGTFFMKQYGDAGNTSITMNQSYTVGNGYWLGFEIIIDNYTSTTEKKPFKFNSYYDSSDANRAWEQGYGIINTTSAITSINFLDTNSQQWAASGSPSGIYVYGGK